MLRPFRTRFLDGIGRADPALSIGQKLWDLVAAIWGPLSLASLWTAVVTSATYITEWWQRLGPLGVSLLAFATFMTALAVSSLASFLKSSGQKKRAEATAQEHWTKVVDRVNPLNNEFHKQRININDLANPFTRRIENKRFFDCELVGPANIVLLGSDTDPMHFGAQLNDCDLVALRPMYPVYNSIILKDCHVYGGSFYKCTFYLLPDLVKLFASIQGSVFITFTGNRAIDDRPPPNFEAKIQQ